MNRLDSLTRLKSWRIRHTLPRARCLVFVALLIPAISFSQSAWELNWLHQLADHRTPAKDRFYRTISDVNSPLTIAAPVGWLAVGILNKNPRFTREAMTWLGAQLVNGALTYSLKVAVNRPRPAVTDPTLTALEGARIHSFPSGHTSSAFALATSVSIDHPQWYVVGPAYLYATLVGYSRCYLGVHYPSDVIAGALLGSGSAWLSDRADHWIRSGNFTKKKKNLAFTY